MIGSRFQKKRILGLFIVLFAFGLSSLTADDPETLYTPRNTLVPDTYLCDEFYWEDRLDLDAKYDSLYPNAEQLTLWGEQYSSSGRYNCHGYAWHMIGDDAINDPVWIGYYSPGQVHKYWDDESYSEVSTSNATTIKYSGDHSATVYSGNTYISKWGSAPLMRHHKDYHPGIYGNPSKYLRKNPATPSDFATIPAAVSDAVASQIVHVDPGAPTMSSNVTIPSDVTFSPHTNVSVPSGKTLTFASGSSLDLYCSYIKSTGGTIIRQSGVSVSPDISVKSGSTLKGQYSIIQVAIYNANSGQDVYVASGSYSGFDMKTGVDVIGAGSASTTIFLQVNFDDVTCTTLSNVTVKSKIVMNSGWDNMISNAIVEKTIELNYGYPQIISGVEADHVTSPDIDIYHGSAEVDGFTSTRIKDWGIYLHNTSDMDIYDSSIEGKDRAIYLEGNSSTSVDDIYFCHNDYDIYAGIQSSGYAGYGTVFSGNPAHTTYGDVDYPYDWECCGFYKRVVSKDGMSAGVLNISTTPAESDDPGLAEYQQALEVYRAIRQKLRVDIKAGKKPNRQQYASDYSNAMDLFKQVVDKYPGTLSSIKALVKVASCYWALNQPQSLSDYLDKIVDNYHYSVLKPHARNLLIPYHLHMKDYQQALQLSDEILADPPDENLSCDALYGKGIIYLYYSEDTTRASEVFQQVLALYPDNPTALSAQSKLEDMGIEYVAPYSALAQVTSEELTIQSYPNPSNPSATLSFSLPEEGDVTLVIYDLLGQEVATLVDGYMDAGRRQVIWSGKTAGGRELPTGIYIARLITPAATRSIKLVLLK